MLVPHPAALLLFSYLKGAFVADLLCAPGRHWCKMLVLLPSKGAGADPGAPLL